MDAVLYEHPSYGKLDYVCAWYGKAADYIRNTNTQCAFVSTNSICQGESVRALWEPLIKKGIAINFAYPSFVWSSEASGQAHVHVVIIGFSKASAQRAEKRIYYSDQVKNVHHINGYLFDAEDVFIASRSKPCNPGAPKMTKGSQPTDGGFLILSKEQKDALLGKYPNMSSVVRRYMGGKEFINNIERYCLWFAEQSVDNFNCPEIRERLNAVAESRAASPTASVRAAADTPELFTQIRQPKTSYLAIPEVSSERRQYIPVGFISSKVIASNQLRFIPTGDTYIFGLLSSKAHMAWMRIVAGRMKSDYRYSPAVWNSFVFPNPTPEQKGHIEQCAQLVLSMREQYPDKSLADLYDPDKMPENLRKAHEQLDAAVEAAYGVDFNGDEEKIVAHLFKLYAEATGE